MGIISKSVGKIIPEAIIFEDFDKNYKCNELRVNQDLKDINKDLKVSSLHKDLNCFVSDFYAFKDQLTQYLNSVVDSKVFPLNFASLVGSAKWYALYYLKTIEGKTQENIKNAVLKLIKIYDIIVYTTLAHLRFEREIYVEFEDSNFCNFDPDLNGDDVIEMVIRSLNEIVKMTDGIYEGKDDEVYNAYRTLCDMDTFAVIKNVEDVFDL